MTFIAFPIDAASGSPAYSSQDTRDALSALCWIAPSGRPIGTVSGARPGTPTNTVHVSGSTWTCDAHSGVIDAESGARAGAYLYATDGSDTGAVNAPNATNPRIDIIYVRIYDDDQDASGFRKGEVDYLAGTAAGSPTAPSAPSRSMVIAQIFVPHSGGGSSSVTWVAPTYGALPYAKLNKTNSQNVADTTEVTVTFQSVDSDTSAQWSSMADVGNNRLVIQVPGLYLLEAQVPWAATTSGQLSAKLQLNGSNITQQKDAVAGSSWGGNGGDAMQTLTVRRLAVGDHITVDASQKTGGTLAVDATAGVLGYLAGTYLGP